MKISDIHKPNISDQFKPNLDQNFAKNKLSEHTKKKHKHIPFDAQSQSTYVISKYKNSRPITLNDFI